MSKSLYYIILVLVLTIITGVLTRLYWLVVSVVVFVIFFFYCNKIIKRYTVGFTKSLLSFVNSIIIIFTTCILLRTFVVDFYKVPSDSMRDTLEVGDIIVLNKLVYGPKLPNNISEVPWFNQWYSKKQFKASTQGIKAIRLNGLGKLKQGDIIVFHLFSRKKEGVLEKETLVKRCVAIAGELIEIKAGQVITNRIPYKDPETVRNTYQVFTKNKSEFKAIHDNLSDNTTSEIVRSTTVGMLKLNASKADILKIAQLHMVDSIKIDIIKSRESKWLLGIKNNPNFTLDNLGPFRVPKRGMKIELNSENYNLYRKALNLYEGAAIKHKNGKFFQNEIEIHNYTFKNNYAFIMGDNRKKSIDSRIYGFIPQRNIIGKVISKF